MIKQKRTIESIKQEVKNLYLKDVLVKVNLGRNKIISYKGKLTGIYPSIITISPYGNKRTFSQDFSYADILCGIVHLKKIEEIS